MHFSAYISTTAIPLQTGEKVTIVASDNKAWCLVKNSKGKQGWFAVDEFCIIRGTNLAASEFFEGLSFAD